MSFEFKISSLTKLQSFRNVYCGSKYMLFALTPENLKFAKERTEELSELFKELDEITG